MKKRTYFIAVITLVSISLLVYLLFLVPTTRKSDFYTVKECEDSPKISILRSEFSDSIDWKDDILTFPVQSYVRQMNYCSFKRLQGDLAYLVDSLKYPEYAIDQFVDKILIEYDLIFPYDTNSFAYNELMDRIILGERALIFGEFAEEKYSFFYQVIGRHWFDKVSGYLSALNEDYPDLKYDHNFKFLVDRCAQNQYNVDLNYTNSEKFINYLIEKRYAYIFNRIWIGTSTWFKILLLLGGVFTLAGYYLLIKKMYLLIKK